MLECIGLRETDEALTKQLKEQKEKKNNFIKSSDYKFIEEYDGKNNELLAINIKIKIKNQTCEELKKNKNNNNIQIANLKKQITEFETFVKKKEEQEKLLKEKSEISTYKDDLKLIEIKNKKYHIAVGKKLLKRAKEDGYVEFNRVKCKIINSDE